MKQITNLKPFKHFCMTIGNLPSSYVDSMSYYETLLWLCNYLKETVIPAVNDSIESVNELQVLYVELKKYVDDYFKDLDVQEMVDNKLDEMAESGQLTDIIAQYLQVASVLAFDTIEDLKAATNLVNGSIVHVLGTSEYDDGDGAYYKIRTVTTEDTIDDYKIVSLTELTTLIAQRIIVPSNYTNHFRYYVDGVNGDDSNDGKTSETAFKTLDRFLESANGSRSDIRCYIIGAGTYTIDKTNIINTMIHITANVEGVEIKSSLNEFVIYNCHFNIENATLTYDSDEIVPYFESCSVVINNCILPKAFQFYDSMLTIQNSTINEIRTNQCQVYLNGITIDGNSKNIYNTPLYFSRASIIEINGNLTFKKLTQSNVTNLFKLFGGNLNFHGTFVFETQDTYDYGNARVDFASLFIDENDFYTLFDSNYNIEGNQFILPDIKIRNEYITPTNCELQDNNSYYNGKSVVINIKVKNATIPQTTTTGILQLPSFCNCVVSPGASISTNAQVPMYGWITVGGTIRVQSSSALTNKEIRILSSYTKI